MLIKKILLSFTILLFSTNLFSQDKKIDNFFLKVQEKKIERLKEKLSDLDNKTKTKIISVILKYDKKIFNIRRKAMMHRRNKGVNCAKRLNRIENQLKIRKKIINLQLKKITELKNLNIDCKIISKIIIFERRFLRKLRMNMRKGNHKRQHFDND